MIEANKAHHTGYPFDKVRHVYLQTNGTSYLSYNTENYHSIYM